MRKLHCRINSCLRYYVLWMVGPLAYCADRHRAGLQVRLGTTLGHLSADLLIMRGSAWLAQPVVNVVQFYDTSQLKYAS
jgi:hypothetical protein